MFKNYTVILTIIAFCSFSLTASGVSDLNLNDAFSSQFNGFEKNCPIDADKKLTNLNETMEKGYSWVLTYYGTYKSLLANFIGETNVTAIEKSLINFGISSLTTALITYAVYSLLYNCLGLAPWNAENISWAAWIIRGASLLASKGAGTVLGISTGIIVSPEVQKKLEAKLEELGFKSTR